MFYFLDVGATLPDTAVRESLRGCIKSMTIGTEAIMFTEAADKVGVFSGCPGASP